MKKGATTVNPMLAELIVGGLDDEDEPEVIRGKVVANPMITGSGGGEASAAQMIAANESAMTDEELSDLTYAFQAADMDGGGIIDADEFNLMLTVMGAEITRQQIMSVIGDAKEGFAAWKRTSDEECVEKCRVIWEEYDEDKSGTMDRKEIAAVIEKLRSMGADPEPISESDMADGELNFDEFMAWYLKQDTLPDEFSAPDGSAPAGGLGKQKKKGVVSNGVRKVLMPLRAVKKVASGPAQLLQQSAKMMKKKDSGKSGEPGSDEPQLSAVELAMEEADQLIFAEFAFMMRAGSLKPYLCANWKERTEDMRKLREAFDAADVDGNNELELEELEMVIISMNPKANIDPADIRKVWEVLNPEGLDWIPFETYVKGMLKVKEDPELAGVVPTDVPNRFQLLSLLIDSPINEDQEKLIFDKLTGLEKGGIKMLEGMRKPMDKAQIKTTLEAACAGKLHDLTQEQRKSVHNTHYWCCLQACFIGTFFTFWPGLLENFLVLSYETDGAVDAYWTCPGTIGDPFADHNEKIAATSEYYGGAEGSPLWPYPLVTCPHGLCATLPANISEYKAMGGTVQIGDVTLCSPDLKFCDKPGNWTQNADGIEGPSSLVGIPPVLVEDMYCQPLPKTFHQSDERDKELVTWWILNIIGIVLGICFEIPLLMYTAVRSAVRVSHSLDLRLTPLNADRAFVANMLVRAAFEMGDPEGDVMGVDSGKESKAEDEGRNPLRDLLAVAFIKGKVVITGVLFKQLTARVVSYDTATFLKPYSGTMLATGMWDTMMCHVIMKNAEIRAFGVTTSVEVFNDILDEYCPLYEKQPESMSEKCKIQMLRAIGVAIVKHGSMFPTLEILLRHAVNYLGMKTSKAVTQGGIIDDELALVDDMDRLTLCEQRAVLCVHMLCYVLGGEVSITELILWKKLLKRVEELYQAERAKFDSFTTAELRDFIVEECPRLKKAVERVPVGNLERLVAQEEEELADIASFVPRPEYVTSFDNLIPRVLCNKFRNMSAEPISAHMISACFDPEAHKEFMVKTLTPEEMTKFTTSELIYKATNILTLQI